MTGRSSQRSAPHGARRDAGRAPQPARRDIGAELRGPGLRRSRRRRAAGVTALVTFGALAAAVAVVLVTGWLP